MISLIMNSYFNVLLCVMAGSMIIFLAGLYWIISHFFSKIALSIPKDDRLAVTAIAGDDVIATQLDLARAYIEMGKRSLAKTLLHYILQEGSSVQQQEAKHLLGLL